VFQNRMVSGRKKCVFITHGDVLGDILAFRHPRTGNRAQYTFSSTGLLLEIQKVSGDESSYFLNDSVMQDGSLFVCSPMDVNFIMLYHLEKVRSKTDEHAGRYVELDDALKDEDYPALPRLAAAKNLRIEMICDINEKHGGRYIRLNDEKVLAWLERKVDAIAQRLASETTESVVSTFNRGPQLTKENINESTPAPTSIAQGEREFSLGILSEYLSAEWTKRLAEHLRIRSPQQMANEDKLTPKMCNTDFFKDDQPSQEDLSKKRKAEAALSTAGNKALKKVDTRGMKSMASFFKPKAKPAKA